MADARHRLWLLAGDSRVPLRWRGGVPPWSVTISRPDGELVLGPIQVTHSEGTFKLRAAQTPGSLVVEIEDRRGFGASYRLELGAQAPYAEYPDPIERVALLLAAPPDGNNWRIEAWRQLLDLPDSAARRALEQRLELPPPAGHRPASAPAADGFSE